MSSGNDRALAKLWKQETTINTLVLNGKREAATVSRVLKGIISEPRKEGVALISVPEDEDEDEIRTHWEELWREFGVKFDPAKVIIPPTWRDLTRVIMMPRGIRQNQLRDISKSLFPCWLYNEDLETAVPFHDRFPLARSYAIRVRDQVEADEENKNFSANQLAEQNLITETLPERLVHELDHFKLTGDHLDKNNITLCTGSRGSDGGVPRVRWGDGRLRAYWYRPDNTGGVLRARAAVS